MGTRWVPGACGGSMQGRPGAWHASGPKDEYAGGAPRKKTEEDTSTIRNEIDNPNPTQVALLVLKTVESRGSVSSNLIPAAPSVGR